MMYKAVAERYSRMSPVRRMFHDLRVQRCWPWCWQLCKVVEPMGAYYTIPLLAVKHPERAAWVQMEGAAEGALKGHWLQDVQWLPIMYTPGLTRSLATREEVAKYVQVTALKNAGRG